MLQRSRRSFPFVRKAFADTGYAGIVRSRLKIEGAIKGARAWLAMAEKGEDFSDYLWGFVDGAPVVNRPKSMADVQVSTPVSEALSKDLKKRGFTFCGPMIVYAFMQAVGMVNDHMEDCWRLGAVRET